LKNQNDKAITDFNKQIEINPQSSDSYIGRALILFERKDYTNAIADCNKAIEINPRHDWAYNARGWIHFNRKSYEQAIADYSKALNISPNYAIALRNRANAYEKIGDKAKAKADRLKAEELEKQVERTAAN
jgi:tetratricopeptide (TPR) repeat protein